MTIEHQYLQLWLDLNMHEIIENLDNGDKDLFDDYFLFSMISSSK